MIIHVNLKINIIYLQLFSSHFQVSHIQQERVTHYLFHHRGQERWYSKIILRL